MQLTDRQKKIRELIQKDSFISAKQMSVVLSVVTRTIWRDLADLQKKGVFFSLPNILCIFSVLTFGAYKYLCYLCRQIRNQQQNDYNDINT